MLASYAQGSGVALQYHTEAYVAVHTCNLDAQEVET